MIRGRLVSKSSNEVVIQVRKGNADLTVRYPLADVASVGVDPPAADPPQAMRKPAAAAPAPATQPSGPTYLVAPIRGQVGLYVTAPLVKTYIAIARAEKPTC